MPAANQPTIQQNSQPASQKQPSNINIYEAKSLAKWKNESNKKSANKVENSKGNTKKK